MVYRWEELREEQFKEAIEKSGGLCVLPIGCSEVHGQHLPCGCDYYQARAFAEAAAEREYVVVFPTGFWMGDVIGAHNHLDPIAEHKAGYIAINPQTLLTLLGELCDEIARNGFRKILILNCHAGNVGMLNYFVRAHAYQPRNYATMWTNAWSKDIEPKLLYPIVKANPEKFPYLTDEDMKTLEKFAKTGSGGSHGHICETAVVQSVVPHCVDVQRSAEVDGHSIHRSDYLTKEGIMSNFGWHSNYPNAFNGYDSLGSTATIGRAMVDVSAERLARIFNMLKEDEDCVRMAMRLPKEE